MKKLISTALIGIMVCGLALPAFGEEPAKTPFISPAPISAEQKEETAMIQKNPCYINTFGILKEVDWEHNRFTVQQNTDPEQTIVFHVSDDFLLLNNEDGMPLAKEDLKEGLRIMVSHSPIMTKSLPPQSAAFLAVGNMEENQTPATYIEVDKVITNENGSITVLNANGDLLVTLPKEMPITPYLTKNIVSIQDIQPGSKLLTWFDMVLTSYPGQTTSQKAVLFPYDYDGYIIIHPSAQQVSINGEKTGISLMPKEDVFYVPLRNVAESLGFTVHFTNAEQGASLQNSQKEIMISGLKEGVDKIGEVSFSAPIIAQNGSYWVPIDFFSQLCQIKVVSE